MSDGPVCGNCGVTWENHARVNECDDKCDDPDCDVRCCPDGRGEWRSETDEDRAALRAAAMGL